MCVSQRYPIMGRDNDSWIMCLPANVHVLTTGLRTRDWPEKTTNLSSNHLVAPWKLTHQQTKGSTWHYVYRSLLVCCHVIHDICSTIQTNNVDNDTTYYHIMDPYPLFSLHSHISTTLKVHMLVFSVCELISPWCLLRRSSPSIYACQSYVVCVVGDR